MIKTEVVGELNGCLSNTFILALPRANEEVVVNSDGREAQSRCVVLFIQNDGVFELICYRSNSDCDAEGRKDSAQHKQCLAVAWSLFMFRPYLNGLHINIRIDQQR